MGYSNLYEDLQELEAMVDRMAARVFIAEMQEQNMIVQFELRSLRDNLAVASDWLQDSRSYFGTIVED